tara:strand:- start:206 stop:598 length:393 start_codon:yes stop_codon:yes gene_type:complete
MNTETEHKSCADRIEQNFQDRYLELQKEMQYVIFSPANYFEKKGLGVDLIEKDDLDLDDHFIRYQLSWGGPQDEFRFWKNGKISYHFMDWFDHAEKDITVMTRQDPVMEKFADLFALAFEGLFQDMQHLD